MELRDNSLTNSPEQIAKDVQNIFNGTEGKQSRTVRNAGAERKFKPGDPLERLDSETQSNAPENATN